MCFSASSIGRAKSCSRRPLLLLPSPPFHPGTVLSYTVDTVHYSRESIREFAITCDVRQTSCRKKMLLRVWQGGYLSLPWKGGTKDHPASVLSDRFYKQTIQNIRPHRQECFTTPCRWQQSQQRLIVILRSGLIDPFAYWICQALHLECSVERLGAYSA